MFIIVQAKRSKSTEVLFLFSPFITESTIRTGRSQAKSLFRYRCVTTKQIFQQCFLCTLLIFSVLGASPSGEGKMGGGWIEQNMDKVHLVWIKCRFLLWNGIKPMKTTCFSHIIVHIKICQLTCCFVEILTQQGKNYGIKVSDGPNKSHLYAQDILVVQKCYLFVFCLKQPKDSLREGPG